MSDGTVPPFDPIARARIEQVTEKLLALVGSLEERIAHLEQESADTADALQALGMVKVPTR